MSVSFVVLNWHAEEVTRRCCDSILSLRGDAAVEIVVVDNESTTDTRAALEDPRWRLVALARNEGFTGGMNAGAAAASGDFVALINNDLVIAEDWLERGLEAMADDGVGIVGGRAQDPDGGPGSTVPRLDPRGFSELCADDTPRGDVPSVDGSHLLVRREVWTLLGGFDEDFFAYYEETDLCARVLAAGWRVVYEPAMTVWHSRGLSSDRVKLKRSFWAKRNRLTWIAKHFPEPTWREAARSAAREYLAHAVTGRDSGWGKGRRLPAPERLASLWAAGWYATHPRRLGAKRADTIAAGQHDEHYRDRLGEPSAPAPARKSLRG